MRKTFNLRIPVLYAAALAFGIIYAAILAFFRLDGIYILIPTAAFLCASAIGLIVTKKLVKPLIFIFATIVFAIGAIYLYCIFMEYCGDEEFVDQFVKITGRVVEVSETSGGSKYMIVNNASVYGTRIKGKFLVYIAENSGDYCRRGYEVSFYGYVSKQSFIQDGKISSRVTDGIRYYCTAHSLEARYRFSLLGEINYAIESALKSNLSDETAAVCLAMLTGNTSGISEGTLTAFRYGGIAHVFAVSGLHIGIIYGALNSLFKRLKLNRFISTALKIVFIVLYSGVCGFSPSSVRAVTMCSVASISSCLFRKYDAWNAVSIAAIILLLINPLYMFGVGFVLSFAAVLGIILLYRNIKKLLFFLPSRVGDTLSVGWSAQFATMPAFMNTFGYISIAGIVLNVILVPIISVLYVMLFVCTLISIIIPAFGAGVLPTACVPLEFFINIISECGIENSIATVNTGYWFFVPFILAFIAISDKFNFPHLYRAIPVALSAVAIVVIIFVEFLPRGTAVEFNSGFSGGSVLIKADGGNVLAVTENYTGYPISEDIDVLVILGGDNSLATAFSLATRCDAVYVRSGAFFVPPVGNFEVCSSDRFVLYDFIFSFEGNTLKIQSDGASFAIVMEEDGSVYGETTANTDIYLYCYGDKPAVLYEGEKNDFDLTYCGGVRYTLKEGALKRRGAVARER